MKREAKQINQLNHLHTVFGVDSKSMVKTNNMKNKYYPDGRR